jgi:hypothetical protein
MRISIVAHMGKSKNQTNLSLESLPFNNLKSVLSLLVMQKKVSFKDIPSDVALFALCEVSYAFLTYIYLQCDYSNIFAAGPLIAVCKRT